MLEILKTKTSINIGGPNIYECNSISGDDIIMDDHRDNLKRNNIYGYSKK